MDAGPSGGMGDRFTYDAYGNLLPGTGLTSSLDNAKTRLGYNGTYTLPNGMQLYGTSKGRMYDSGFGGWTQQDAYRPDVFNSMDQDLYGYVHGNPINSWDPDGQRGRRTRPYIPDDGYDAEWEIRKVYDLERPDNDADFGKLIVGGVNLK